MLPHPKKPIIALAFTAVTGLAAPIPPAVFWISNPVFPDETVLLQGDGLDSAAVEAGPLADTPPGPPPSAQLKS